MELSDLLEIICQESNKVKGIKTYKLQPPEFVAHNFPLPWGVTSCLSLMGASYLTFKCLTDWTTEKDTFPIPTHTQLTRKYMFLKAGAIFCSILGFKFERQRRRTFKTCQIYSHPFSTLLTKNKKRKKIHVWNSSQKFEFPEFSRLVSSLHAPSHLAWIQDKSERLS